VNNELWTRQVIEEKTERFSNEMADKVTATAMEMSEILSKEIARELIKQEFPDDVISEDYFDKLYERCQGNPWNIAPLYAIIKHTGKQI